MSRVRDLADNNIVFVDGITTADVTEGSNLFFTNTRADARAQLKIDALVDSAPGALNTLNELAAALGDDASFSTTITNSIATKLPLAGGTMTGDIAMGLHQIVFDNNSQAIQIKDAGGTASYVLYQDSADTLILGNGTTVEKIRLDTSGNEGAVVIDTNGNVGIGTLSPTPTASNYNSASLHISQVGSSSVGAQIRFSTGVTGHTASDGTFMSQWADSNFYITNQEANADIRFNAGGNSDMVVFDGQNGSVGINFSNPASTGARLAVMGDAGSNAIFVKGNAGSGTSWGMGINAGSTSADASFRVYDKDGSNSYLFVRGDGKVGIGTTSPDVKLHVEETTSNTGVGIKIESASWDSTLTLANGSHSWEILNDYSNSSSLAFYSSQGAAVKLIVTSDGNAHLSGQIDARIQLSSSGGANTVSDNTVYIRGNDDTAILNSAANGDINLSENGTSRLFIKRTTGNVGIGTTAPTTGLDIYGAGNIPRIKLRESSGHQVNFGLWDGVNYRMEGDSNRPLFITSYHSNGVAIGGSGATNMQVTTGGVDFLPNTSGSFRFKGNGGNQLSIVTSAYTAGAGTNIAQANVQVVNSAFGALVFIAGYNAPGYPGAQFCDLVYFGYNASPTILAQQTIAGSPPTRYYTGSGYALYLRYSSNVLTTKVNCIQSHS